MVLEPVEAGTAQLAFGKLRVARIDRSEDRAAPLRPCTDQASDASEAADGCAAGLVVEDEPVFRELLQAALRELGPSLPTRAAGCGAEALRALSEPDARFSIVLVDLGLPDMSGIEVIRAVRTRHPDTPVLVASIHSDEAHVLDAIRAGARGYLLKDDTALGISDAISRAMHGEYPISPSLARHLFRMAQPAGSGGDSGPGLMLAPKELELLALLAKGTSYKRAASSMGVALSTVQTYVRRVYQKLEAHSKVEAITRARSMGLLD